MEQSEIKVWKSSFFQDNFDVDQCLSKYTLKSDLVTLRDDLRLYGAELHQRMAEILKAETEAIVSLAEHLTDISAEVAALAAPLAQLREEVRALHELVRGAEAGCLAALRGAEASGAARARLRLRAAAVAGAARVERLLARAADPPRLERAVGEHAFQLGGLRALGLAGEGEVARVGRRLVALANEAFAAAAAGGEPGAVLRCLRMYDDLGEHAEAEKTYQVGVVRPALTGFFSKSNLEKSDWNIEQVYSSALAFIDLRLAPILEILSKNPELTAFNFILNSFWPEVDQQSRDNLPHITAPGNPELFQSRYKSTWDFLLRIATLCGDPNLIHTNASFQAHIKRFNLPVYFEIRFQQIAGRLEAEAVKPGVAYGGGDFRLALSATLWACLRTALSPAVFIHNLADQFLKFSMLLLSRYCTWLDGRLRAADGDGRDLERFVLAAICDLNRLDARIGVAGGGRVEGTIYAVLPAGARGLDRLFALNSRHVGEFVRKLEDRLVGVKVSDSLRQLQNVASIPRLYRRTNRLAPKEASNYMVETVEPILRFSQRKEEEIDVHLQRITDRVVVNISKQYLELVEEVLSSVCKTEESLRRLKTRGAPMTESVSDDLDTMSDEMKIREQIRLDIIYFVAKLEPCVFEGGRAAISELRQKLS